MLLYDLFFAANMTAFFAATHIGTSFAADARQELYASLLGKSQTVFDRLRVGDLMARATDDVSQLSDMIVPGAISTRETTLGDRPAVHVEPDTGQCPGGQSRPLARVLLQGTLRRDTGHEA